MLKELKAKDGKFSILGNHDYGDYIKWASREAKIENLYRLIDHQHKAGFELLLNEHATIKKDGQSIKLVGVENWGKPPFPQHGDLNKALNGVCSEDFVVLMSHDPSHWDLEVLKTEKKIHLTLSGHTHGMQMGIDIPGLKWSPVKYKYPRWSGLYEELGRYLYVNNGFGFLGFAGRVGIYPEITVLELQSEN
jgi:predicted MPP superfamily phosphohydrolase